MLLIQSGRLVEQFIHEEQTLIILLGILPIIISMNFLPLILRMTKENRETRLTKYSKTNKLKQLWGSYHYIWIPTLDPAMDSRILLKDPLATWVTETSFMLDLLYNCYIYFEPVDQFT